MVIELTKENFDSEIKKGVTVVDLWASWCFPCKKLSPIIEELSNEVKQVRFAKLNVDENEDIATRYGIMGLPTIILFKNGNDVGRVVGFFDKDALKKKFRDILGSSFA